MKEQRTTTSLLRTISQAPMLNQALESKAEEVTLDGHLQAQLQKSGVSASVLMQRMLVSKPFVYQILNGTRKPGRDILLRMALALELSLEETQRLLTVAQRGVLYPRVRRDAALIYAVQHHYTLTETDEALRSIGEQPLLDMTE